MEFCYSTIVFESKVSRMVFRLMDMKSCDFVVSLSSSYLESDATLRLKTKVMPFSPRLGVPVKFTGLGTSISFDKNKPVEILWNKWKIKRTLKALSIKDFLSGDMQCCWHCRSSLLCAWNVVNVHCVLCLMQFKICLSFLSMPEFAYFPLDTFFSGQCI